MAEADDTFAFSADQRRALALLLDAVVPASSDGRLPAAGALGLTSDIERTVRETPMVRPVLEYGLSALAELAARKNPAGFAALSVQETADVLREFTATDGFFLPAFLFLVYSAYYQHPRVLAALGREHRPPHPKGYTMEPSDWTLLDPVRRSGRRPRNA